MPVEHAEVRAVEREDAVERRLARLVGLPGPERSARRDLARRNGVGQRRLERHRPVRADTDVM